MKKWDDAVKSTLRAYTQRNQYAYFYGAKGQVLTDGVMDALIFAEQPYFDRYSEEQMRQIRDNSRGKIGYDCSGFVGWLCTGDRQFSTGSSKIIPLSRGIWQLGWLDLACIRHMGEPDVTLGSTLAMVIVVIWRTKLRKPIRLLAGQESGCIKFKMELHPGSGHFSLQCLIIWGRMQDKGAGSQHLYSWMSPMLL